MRLRSLNTISLLIILISLATLTGVPGLRRVAEYAVTPRTEIVDYAREAERLGDDAQAWLAVFSGDARVWVSAEDRAHARERLIELLPDSAAPYLLDGVQEVPLSRAEIDAWAGSGQVTKEEPLTDQQRRRVQTLLDGFERASQLDPDNAAVDYLRAYLAFADHQDEEGYGRLRDALAKSRWDLYQREAAIAAYRMASRRQPPGVALLARTAIVFHPQLALERLVCTVTGMAILAEQRGDHAQAILLRESALRLAQQMLTHADGVSDALMGIIVWKTASAQPPAEDLGPGEEARQEERPSHMLTDGALGLVAYLRAHGRPQLAEEVLSFSRSADDSSARIVDHVAARFMLQPRPSEALALTIRGFAHAVLWSLAVVLAAGIVALLLRMSRRRVAPVRCSRLGWAVVVVVILAVVFGAGILDPAGLASQWPSSHAGFARYFDWPSEPWEYLFVALGLPLILIAVLVLVVMKRGDRGFMEIIAQYAATLIAVLLPLSAFYCLVLAGVSAAGARESPRQAEIDRAIVEQGELRYYDLALK